MRLMTIATILLFVGLAQAKSAVDKEGNCVPEVLSEHAHLYSEIEVLDKMATTCEAQLKSEVKESQKAGFDGLKQLSSKAKSLRKSIAQFSSEYRNASCKAQLPKKGKMEVIVFDLKEKTASLDKLAVAYEEMADKFLKTHQH